jgi:hypothetical protein
MNIVILGNGQSLKSVHDYGFEKFLTHCKDKNIKVLCMNKILRYFDKEQLNIYPNYYVASDTLVNIQMYDEILNHIDKFENSFISVPYQFEIKNNKATIKKRKDLAEQTIPFDKNKKKIQKQINLIKSKSTIINHQNTGLSSIFIASMLKPQNIYMIGLDETYELSNDKTICADSSDNKNYFTDSYLKKGEYVSNAPKSRIDDINNLIMNIQKNCNVYNLSEISNLDGIRMSFDNFLLI